MKTAPLSGERPKNRFVKVLAVIALLIVLAIMSRRSHSNQDTSTSIGFSSPASVATVFPTPVEVNAPTTVAPPETTLNRAVDQQAELIRQQQENARQAALREQSEEITRHQERVTDLQQEARNIAAERAEYKAKITAYMMEHPKEVAGAAAGIGGATLALNPELSDGARVASGLIAAGVAIYYAQHPDERDQVVEVAAELAKASVEMDNYQKKIDAFNSDIQEEQAAISRLRGN